MVNPWTAIGLSEPVGDPTFRRMWANFFENRKGCQPLEKTCAEFFGFAKRISLPIPPQFQAAAESVLSNSKGAETLVPETSVTAKPRPVTVDDPITDGDIPF